jgi:hypothetical protein
MAVDNASVVDAVGIENASGEVVLTVSDHLDWVDEAAHLEVLQSKLNTYLAFVESGELLEQYPGAAGRPVRIEVVLKYPPSASAERFFSEAAATVQAAGFTLAYVVFRD